MNERSRTTITITQPSVTTATTYNTSLHDTRNPDQTLHSLFLSCLSIEASYESIFECLPTSKHILIERSWITAYFSSFSLRAQPAYSGCGRSPGHKHFIQLIVGVLVSSLLARCFEWKSYHCFGTCSLCERESDGEI
jgi:hypothetical protein